jgi:hypothetical protein
VVERHLDIHLDLGAVLAQLQRALQRSVDLVSFGLHAAETAANGSLALPGVYFHVAAASDAALNFDQAKQEFPPWLVGHGLRDSIEAVGLFLEEVRKVCAVWSLSNETTGAKWMARMVEETKKFHRRGLPEKLTFLEKEYGLAIPPLKDQILSINAARNCIVHRRGIVHDQDANSPKGLRVQWRKYKMFVDGPSGRREIVPPAMVEGGERLVLIEGDAEKVFAKGNIVGFSAQEFSEICWSLLSFGIVTIKNLEAHGRAKGMSFDQPAKQ